MEMIQTLHGGGTIPPGIEPWVGSKIIAAHLGFSDDQVRKMANEGLIPGFVSPGSKKRYWRFKLSEVDAALSKLSLAAVTSSKGNTKGK